jgi:hypothetical protein
MERRARSEGYADEEIGIPVRPVRGRRPRGRGLVIVLFFLLLLAAASAAYFYRQYSLLKSDPSVAVKSETAQLIEEVGKLIVLPEDETPTVATVSDVEKLKSEAFFAKAKNGDKVLIYSAAKKAILYDPIARKIVEIAPINVGANPAVSSGLAPSQQAVVKTSMTTSSSTKK